MITNAKNFRKALSDILSVLLILLSIIYVFYYFSVAAVHQDVPEITFFFIMMPINFIFLIALFVLYLIIIAIDERE